jgi:DNA-binding GntR family transcriptional regulator
MTEVLVEPVLAAAVPPSGMEHTSTEAHHTYQRLRAAILLGRLAPAEPLVESELMSILQVGRTPLREAVRMLMHDGLVEVLPRRGTYVTMVDLAESAHLLAARRGLERVVATRAVACGTRSEIGGFEEFVERARSSSSSEENDLALDTEFHARILAMTHNRYVEPTYWRMVGESMRMLRSAGAAFDDSASMQPAFDGVAEGLRRGDPTVVDEALQSHIDSFERRLHEIIRGWQSNLRHT